MLFFACLKFHIICGPENSFFLINHLPLLFLFLVGLGRKRYSRVSSVKGAQFGNSFGKWYFCYYCSSLRISSYWLTANCELYFPTLKFLFHSPLRFLFVTVKKSQRTPLYIFLLFYGRSGSLIFMDASWTIGTSEYLAILQGPFSWRVIKSKLMIF